MTARVDGSVGGHAAQGTPWRGVGWMLGAMILNTLELALVHLLGSDWPAPVQLFWRQGVALLLLLPILLCSPRTVLAVSRPALMLFRSVAAVSALLLSIYAYSHLALATANALSFTRPLWVLLLAALMLGERVDGWRGGAVAFGFAGVLVMVRPWGGNDDGLAVIAALASSLLFAASFVSIKSMSGDNRTTTILIYGVLFGLLVSSGPAWWMWRQPNLHDGLCLIALGFTSLGGFACFANALRIADAAALVGLDYLRLPLSGALGILMFGEQPTLALLVGSVMIAGASLSVVLRDRQAKRNS